MDYLEMFPAFWLGGFAAVFVIGTGIRERMSSGLAYLFTLIFVATLWPITVWFMTQTKTPPKSGPWNPKT